MDIKPKLPARAHLLPTADERWEGHVRIPALLKPDGTLVPWASESWPKVLQECMVDVTVPLWSLTDEAERGELARELEMALLPLGSEVRFRISRSGVPAELLKHVIENEPVFPDPGASVSVMLRSELRLVVRPSRRSQLMDVDCVIPAINKKASSLNEAYKVLSEAFEPHRRSQGGNVYLKGHYLDEGWWLQLDALRRWVEAGRKSPFGQS